MWSVSSATSNPSSPIITIGPYSLLSCMMLRCWLSRLCVRTVSSFNLAHLLHVAPPGAPTMRCETHPFSQLSPCPVHNRDTRTYTVRRGSLLRCGGGLSFCRLGGDRNFVQQRLHGQQQPASQPSITTHTYSVISLQASHSQVYSRKQLSNP
jgi:hypothetical protein